MIISLASYFPVIVQLDIGSIQKLYLQSGQFPVAHIGNQNVMPVFKIFRQEDFPFPGAIHIQLCPSTLLLHKAYLIVSQIVVHEDIVYDRTC